MARGCELRFPAIGHGLVVCGVWLMGFLAAGAAMGYGLIPSIASILSILSIPSIGPRPQPQSVSVTDQYASSTKCRHDLYLSDWILTRISGLRRGL